MRIYALAIRLIANQRWPGYWFLIADSSFDYCVLYEYSYTRVIANSSLDVEAVSLWTAEYTVIRASITVYS